MDPSKPRPTGCPPVDFEAAHKHSSRHRGALLQGGPCGCFYCLEIFDPRLISEWTDEGRTAICPFCGIDSIIGEASGFPIERWFLEGMHLHWFSTQEV